MVYPRSCYLCSGFAGFLYKRIDPACQAKIEALTSPIIHIGDAREYRSVMYLAFSYLYHTFTL
jgi:hypothetical protein